MALLALSVLGFRLAWEKGIRGSQVVWIGAELSASPDGVQVTIPQDKLSDLSLQTEGSDKRQWRIEALSDPISESFPSWQG